MKGCRSGSTLYQDWMSPNGDGTWNYNSRTTSYNSAGDITGYHYTGKHYGTLGTPIRLTTPPQFFPFVAILLPDFNALANIMSGDGTAEDWASVATDLPWLKGVKLIPDSVKEKGFKAVQDWLKKSGCTQCFLAGTEVLMSDGSTKDIEDVRVGDKVLATDPTTGKTGPREVTALIITEDDKHFNEISIATEQGIEQISPTHEHPFWSPSQKEWVEARNLKPGMTLLTDAGKTVIVTDNRPFKKQARTYNLTVADLHTYYVLAGSTPVLVHNSGPCPTARFVTDANGVTIDLKPLGRGSTGRTAPNSLNEQLAMETVMANPMAGRVIPLKKGMTDPRWMGSDGWVKMTRRVNIGAEGDVEIHYVMNTITGHVDDYKFK
jgi:hypothetical protein